MVSEQICRSSRLARTTPMSSQATPTDRRLDGALEALARRLLAAGISAAEFQSAAGQAFVRVALSVARLKNGKINQSKVAIMTGFSRREVRKFLIGGRSRREEKAFGAKRLLDGWARDPEFSGRTGNRKSLPVTGAYGSFHSLCKKYSGDIPSKAALDELVRLGLVRKQRGKVHDTTVSRPFVASPREKEFESLIARLEAALLNADEIASLKQDVQISDELEFHFGKESSVEIAEDRLRQGMRAFMNGLSASVASLQRTEREGAVRPVKTIKVRIVLSRSSGSPRKIRNGK